MRIPRAVIGMIAGFAITSVSLAVASTAHAAEGGCAPSGYSGGSVSADDALARAAAWVAVHRAYDQSVCANTPQGTYREDCSGFVSMAWELDSSLITTQFNPRYDGGDSRFLAISRDDLQPGDALVDDVSGNPADGGEHHIALFTGWDSVDQGRHRYADISEEGSPNTGTVARTDQDLVSGYWSAFTPIHYSQLTNGASSPSIAINPAGRYLVGLEANGTDKLWNWNGAPNTAGVGTATTLGMAPGTSPSVVVLSNGNPAVAFHANDGRLWTWTAAGGGTPTGLGMAPGTSPSLALLPNGNLVAAFHSSSTDLLWTWTGAPNTAGVGTAAQVGLAAGTSPSLAVLTNGSLAVAFHASGTDLLWTWTSTGGGTATQVGLAPGTSPSLAVLANGSLAVAFHASGTDLLWTWTSTGGGTATQVGVASGTSPAIGVLPNGNPAVAFHASGSDYLWTWTAAGGGAATHLGMATGTSPSLAVRTDGSLAVAFHARDDLMWTWTGAPNTAGTGTASHDGMG